MTFRHFVIFGVVVFICFQLYRTAEISANAADTQSGILPFMLPLLLMIPLTRWTKNEMREIIRLIRNKEGPTNDIPTRRKEP